MICKSTLSSLFQGLTLSSCLAPNTPLPPGYGDVSLDLPGEENSKISLNAIHLDPRSANDILLSVCASTKLPQNKHLTLLSLIRHTKSLVSPETRIASICLQLKALIVVSYCHWDSDSMVVRDLFRVHHPELISDLVEIVRRYPLEQEKLPIEVCLLAVETLTALVYPAGRNRQHKLVDLQVARELGVQR